MVFPITKTQGYNHNFYQQLTISGTSFNTTGPDVVIPFSPRCLILTVESTSASIDVSFNGNSVDEHLNSSIAPLQQLICYDRAESLLWFKVATGSVVVSVRAWQIK